MEVMAVIGLSLDSDKRSHEGEEVGGGGKCSPRQC